MTERKKNKQTRTTNLFINNLTLTIMKKNLLILAVAGLALASCSNDETVAVNQGDAISFRPLMSNVTRAADVTAGTGTNGLQTESNGFFVTAIHKTTGESPVTSTYFDDVKFYYSSSTGTYNSDKKYYWPASGTLDFFAYAPAIPEESPQVARTDYKTFTVTPSTTVANQVDLVYANTDGKTKTGAYTPSGGAEASTFGAAGVPLNFRHTGAKIVVKVKNSASNNLKFDITGMKIVNVDGSATFTYNDTPSSGDDNTDKVEANTKQLLVGDWGSNSDAQTVTYSVTLTTNTINTQQTEAQFLNASGTIGTLDESVNMILIPQTTPDATSTYSAATENAAYTGSYIALKLVISNIAGTNESPIYTAIADASQNITISDTQYNNWAMWPVKFTWAPGKKYTYTIDLAGGGYWERNNDTDADLDPILQNAEIKFVDVTVDDWSDATGIDVTGPTL